MSQAARAPRRPPRERLAAFAREGAWYHTIELGEGIVTEGTYDHREHLDRYRFPRRLDGYAVLDVGAADGFFSFEFERRGAKHVLAVDTNAYDGTIPVDVSPSHRETYESKYVGLAEVRSRFGDVYEALGVPVGHQFLAVRALLGSRVAFENRSVYELGDLGRRFDLVFCGDLIEHLKDPLRAIENLAAVTKGLCVVSLSSALRDRYAMAGIRSATWASVVLRRAANLLGVPAPDRDEVLRYVGNRAGGSFFHFGPESFRQALLASGFREAKIEAGFGLRNRSQGVVNPHVVYHCTTTGSPS